MPKVIVAHPNKQHSMQLAFALQKEDMLTAYITRLYTTWQHQPFSYLRWLPLKLRTSIEKSLFNNTRHNHLGLQPSKVKVYDLAWFILPTLFRNFKILSKQEWVEILVKNSVHFQKRVAKFAIKEKVNAVICYDGTALNTFKEIKSRNADIKLILDLSSAHPSTIKSILKEELNLSQDYASNIKMDSFLALKLYDRISQEITIADYVLAGSNFVKTSCLENGIPEEKIIPLPYGTDFSKIKTHNTKRAKQKFVLLFVGRVERLKGIFYLLEAVKQIDLAEKIDLLLCGNILDENEFLQPYEKYFQHLGYVPHIKMPDVYMQADVFVLPTLLEGLSQACLEAMASSKPVITTPNSGLEGILRDGEDGFIVPIRDVNALVEKIIWLYEHRDACKQMGLNARKTVEQYTWERYYAQAASIMREIFNN